LRHLGISLGILDGVSIPFLLDVVFVLVDLEVSREEREMARNAGKPPLVKEFGIATLDTWDISCPNAPAY